MSSQNSMLSMAETMYEDGKEFEMRIGRIVGGRFCPGLSFLTFAKLYTTTKNKYSARVSQSHMIDYIKGRDRLTVYDDGTEALISKKDRVTRDFQGKGITFDVRLSSCLEEPYGIVNDIRVSHMDNPDMVREKDRATVSFDGFHIDFTVVTLLHTKQVFSGDQEKESVTYEVEIEVESKEALEEAQTHLYSFMKLLGDGSSYAADCFTPLCSR